VSKILEAIEHFRKGRHAQAEAIYQSLLAAQPHDADALHYLGVLRFAQKRDDEAFELLTRALKVAPKNPDAWNSLGNIVLGMRKPPAAEFAFQNAVELRPGFVEAWYNLANVQRRMHKREDALASFRRVLELNPKVPNTHEAVANLLVRLKRFDEAGEAFRAWLKADPANPIAQHMASAYSNETPQRADAAYVAKLFDRVAGHFETTLATLKYAVPQMLTAALSEYVPFGEKRLTVLDAGCGTGLCGPLLRSSSRRLVGVDLSAGMLAKARERNIFDELHEADLVGFMRAHPAEYDVVFSADTLEYFGALEEPAAAAAVALKPNGLLAFTVEALPPGSGEKYRISETGRYVHHPDYVRDALTTSGFSLLQLETGVLRMALGSEVQGLVVVARKAA
jgi:predicted TPR repeat methyltransferase